MPSHRRHPFGDGVNWAKAEGYVRGTFALADHRLRRAALLLLVVKAVRRDQAALRSAERDKPPAWWIRLLLVLTCTGVSFAHGSNDGQKGMGLIMLILIGIVPGVYALNPTADASWRREARLRQRVRAVDSQMDRPAPARRLADKPLQTRYRIS